MRFSLEKRAKLKELSERCADVLVDIIEEGLPKAQKATGKDEQFKSILFEMYNLCPLLSDSYMQMYNEIQKEKISASHKYYKRLRKNK